jgi:hypothetical protein
MRRTDLVASLAEPRTPRATATPTAGARPAPVVGEPMKTTAVNPEGQEHSS